MRSSWVGRGAPALALFGLHSSGLQRQHHNSTPLHVSILSARNRPIDAPLLGHLPRSFTTNHTTTACLTGKDRQASPVRTARSRMRQARPEGRATLAQTARRVRVRAVGLDLLV